MNCSLQKVISGRAISTAFFGRSRQLHRGLCRNDDQDS